MEAFAHNTPQKQNLLNLTSVKKFISFIKKYPRPIIIFFFTSMGIIQKSVYITLTFLCWNLTVTVSPVEFWRSTMSGLIWGGTTTESSWPQNVYWQNTKLDMDEGRPLAERIVN